MYITSKLSVVEFYVTKIGHFDGEYDTAEKQSLLINHCARKHIEILEIMGLCSNIYKVMALVQTIATVGNLVIPFFHILIVSTI